MDIEVLKLIKFVGAILAAAAAIYSLTIKNVSVNRKRVILLAWLVAPPIFFYFEYFFQTPLLTSDELSRFKDLQSLASGIWAGIAAALAIAYFKKD